MAVSGLPVANGIEHSRQVALMSLELVEAIRDFTVPHMRTEQLKLRVGLHSGRPTSMITLTCTFLVTMSTVSLYSKLLLLG